MCFIRYHAILDTYSYPIILPPHIIVLCSTIEPLQKQDCYVHQILGIPMRRYPLYKTTSMFLSIRWFRLLKTPITPVAFALMSLLHFVMMLSWLCASYVVGCSGCFVFWTRISRKNNYKTYFVYLRHFFLIFGLHVPMPCNLRYVVHRVSKYKFNPSPIVRRVLF